MLERHGSVPGLLDWGVAARALAGEPASGDLSLVLPVDSGSGVLVAVVDGLGHGPEAAAAARTAVGTLEQFAHEPVGSLLQRCHHALLGKRGVVMSLARLDGVEHSMTWVGVGNVEGLLVNAGDPAAHPQRSSLITRGGIIGSAMPPTRPWVIPVTRGDLLVFTTDGVQPVYRDAIPSDSRESPGTLAASLLTRFQKGTDDALVLVARYLAGGSS
jgi:hypothetical protein